MPEISRFLGIIITMHWSDEGKHHMPHFHAKYNKYKCVYSLPDLEVLAGGLPQRATSFVNEWALQHIDELMVNWNNVKNHKPSVPIEPLH